MTLRFAWRALLIGYVVAAVLWGLALFGGHLVAAVGGYVGSFFFVMAFGAGHAVIAALFVAAVFAAGRHILCSRGAGLALGLCVFCASMLSSLASAWYAYFFFHG